jgi:hypothetical protein
MPAATEFNGVISVGVQSFRVCSFGAFFSIVARRVEECAQEPFVEGKTEVKLENVLRKFNSEAVGDDAPETGAEAQLLDVVFVELVKRLRARECEPGFRLPCPLPRTERNIYLEEAAEPADAVPIVRSEVSVFRYS